MTTPNTTSTTSTAMVQLTHTITKSRLSSPPPMSRVTRTTAPVGMATPISQDLIWPGHTDIQGTSLFPQDDDPATVAAGGLDPEERWEIHHPYDIPAVRRPTMETPDNLRRLTECEALVESLQTMEYLTEFPTLEERQDYRRFPFRYGEPNYHLSRLKRPGDNGQRRREGEDRPPNGRLPPGRNNRRSGIGYRGFMSPMRRVADAAQRTPEAQYSEGTETQRRPQTMSDTQYINEDRDSTPRPTPPSEERTPTTREPYSNQWEDNSREPEIIVECVPLLNGGPPTSQNEPEAISRSVVVFTTAPITTTETTTIESASIPSTPQVHSTGIGERITTSRPICLPVEDPQIHCPVCHVVDCMIHNLRHRYCMNCGQRLLGPYACPNERECPEPLSTVHPISCNRL